MENIHLQLAIMDIKVRDYLNIKSFHKPTTNVYQEMILVKKDIPYIWLNASTLAIGYIIKTIDGDVTKPIIGIKTLKFRRKMHKHLFKKYNIFAERRRKIYLKNAISCLILKTKLPNELIKHILEWTDLIHIRISP